MHLLLGWTRRPADRFTHKGKGSVVTILSEVIRQLHPGATPLPDTVFEFRHKVNLKHKVYLCPGTDQGGIVQGYKQVPSPLPPWNKVFGCPGMESRPGMHGKLSGFFICFNNYYASKSSLNGPGTRPMGGSRRPEPACSADTVPVLCANGRAEPSHLL